MQIWFQACLSAVLIASGASGTEFTDGVTITTQSTVPLRLKDMSSDTRIEIVAPDGQGGFQQWIVGQHSFSFVIKGPNDKDIFKVKPQAPESTLLLDNSGNVGIGNYAALTALHVTRPLDATLRLETTGGGAIPAQTWDLTSNFTEFLLVDDNTGVAPFGVESGTPEDLLYLASAGNIGMGTRFPATLMHAHKAAVATVAETIAQFDVSDDSVGKLEISNASTTNGIFHPRIRGTTALQATPITMEGVITDDVGTNPLVSFAGSKRAGGSIVNRPLVVFRNNQTVKAKVAANGDVFATSFNPTSSRTMKDDIVELDSRKASDALALMTPVEYVYKDDPTVEKRIGFIAEDVPELIANADRKSVPIMDVVALVTKVVKDQQQTIDEQNKRIEDLMRRLNDLERTTQGRE